MRPKIVIDDERDLTCLRL